MEYHEEIKSLNSMRHKKVSPNETSEQKTESLFSTIIIRSEVRGALASFSVGKIYDQKIIELPRFNNDRKEVNK